MKFDRTALVLITACACWQVACRSKPPPQQQGVPSATASLPPLPVDHLADGELAEGKEVAFGFRFPKGFQVTRQFQNAAYATAPVSAERTANYIRRRVTASTEAIGPTRTIFQLAQVKNQPQKHPLRIEVNRLSYKTEIVVHHLVPPPVDKRSWIPAPCSNA
jgi:hypothetical protein